MEVNGDYTCFQHNAIHSASTIIDSEILELALNNETKAFVSKRTQVELQSEKE